MYWGLTLFGVAYVIIWGGMGMALLIVGRPDDLIATIPLSAVYLFFAFYGFISFRVGLFHIRNGREATTARWRYRFLAIISGFVICFAAISLALDSAIRSESIAYLFGYILAAAGCCFGLFVGLRHFRRNAITA